MTGILKCPVISIPSLFLKCYNLSKAKFEEVEQLWGILSPVAILMSGEMLSSSSSRDISTDAMRVSIFRTSPSPFSTLFGAASLWYQCEFCMAHISLIALVVAARS